MDSVLADLKGRLNSLLSDIDHMDVDYSDDQLALIDETLANFRDAGADLLDQATPHLWAYYQDTFAEYGAVRAAQYGIPLLDLSTDIWTQVRIDAAPSVVLGHGRLAPAPVYLAFEGEVSWEREHGLELVVERGLRVCKVGPYDGHPTVAAACGDLSLLGAIYR